MANRTDTQRQADFTGTLEERRKLYQERRLKNGIKADRVITKMREESGLGDANTTNNDLVSAWKVILLCISDAMAARRMLTPSPKHHDSSCADQTTSRIGRVWSRKFEA
jgi:hypothetical protein